MTESCLQSIELEVLCFAEVVVGGSLMTEKELRQAKKVSLEIPDLRNLGRAKCLHLTARPLRSDGRRTGRVSERVGVCR